MNFTFALKLTVFAPGAKECGPFFFDPDFTPIDGVRSPYGKQHLVQSFGLRLYIHQKMVLDLHIENKDLFSKNFKVERSD